MSAALSLFAERWAVQWRSSLLVISAANHESSVARLSFAEMKRVAVIGCGGSGKTTLSRQLGELLGLPVVHIDAHYWRWVDGAPLELTPVQWAERHRGLVAGDGWIIDGMKLGVLGERLAAADTVIYLDVSTLSCLSGVLRRRIRFRGRLRPELGVYDRIDWQFVRWIVSFRRWQRPRILELLGGYDGDLIVVTHRGALKRLLEAVNRSAGSASGLHTDDDRAQRAQPERYETGVR